MRNSNFLLLPLLSPPKICCNQPSGCVILLTGLARDRGDAVTAPQVVIINELLLIKAAPAMPAREKCRRGASLCAGLYVFCRAPWAPRRTIVNKTARRENELSKKPTVGSTRCCRGCGSPGSMLLLFFLMYARYKHEFKKTPVFQITMWVPRLHWKPPKTRRPKYLSESLEAKRLKQTSLNYWCGLIKTENRRNGCCTNRLLKSVSWV